MTSKLLSKISKKIADTKKHGLFWVLKKLFRDHIYYHERHALLKRDLSVPFQDFSGRERKWSFGFVEDQKHLEKFRINFPDKVNEFRKYYDQGVFCGMSFYEDILVGYTLWSGVVFRDPIYNIVVRPGEFEAYQFAGYLLPKYRGTPISINGMKFGHNYLIEKGFKGVFCYVDTENALNMRFHFKLGFEEGGCILHVRKLLFFRWSRPMYYEGRRYDHFAGKKSRNLAAPAGAD